MNVYVRACANYWLIRDRYVGHGGIVGVQAELPPNESFSRGVAFNVQTSNDVLVVRGSREMRPLLADIHLKDGCLLGNGVGRMSRRGVRQQAHGSVWTAHLLTDVLDGVDHRLPTGVLDGAAVRKCESGR